MEEKFIQKSVELNRDQSTGILKIEDLWRLMENHPYADDVYEVFHIEKIKHEFINIDYIDTIFKRIQYYNKHYKRHSILAETKDINLYQETNTIDGKEEKSIFFHFDEYVIIDEIKKDLKTVAIYDSKNTYLDEFVMTKYANNLFKKGFAHLARENVQYFKDLASSSDNYNKHKSYRLVENEGVNYLRGITSINKYFEYGVDFTFVTAMLAFHNFMKENKGIEYKIRSASVNESKLEIIVVEKFTKNAGAFGEVSSAVKISTNDLGQGSLNFVNIINVGEIDKNGFFLFPRQNSIDNNRIIITHTTKPENVYEILKNLDGVLNTSDKFISQLKEAKAIKTPDELRMKIRNKIEGHRSPFKDIKNLSDIFKPKIDNEISHFSKLLQMCNKAEELNIDFDLKDKLRYLISDIILYGTR